MTIDNFEEAEEIERNSTIVILAASLVCVLLVFSGLVGQLGARLGAGEGVSVIGFSVLTNFVLVLYQVSAGKQINRLAKRPYI